MRKDFTQEKARILSMVNAFDACEPNESESVLETYVAPDYHWRGMHPFYERTGAKAVCNAFWTPFKKSFGPLQRRMDFFFAGTNDCDAHQSAWVCNAGHFLGQFREDWLGIPATGKIVMHRYAEFHRVANDKILESALFLDILSIMHQAGVYPLPPMTGHFFVYPGPRTHDGLLLTTSCTSETHQTHHLLNSMITDLDAYNQNASDLPSPDSLRKTWVEDMLWFGPAGIGASYTIPGYQEQHQIPFRKALTDKTYNGHIARIAEGNYAGFFGWPNLNNRNMGGFLGLPSSSVHAPMRVVDLYRRDGDKFAENWVYIDLLHYLHAQGLDVLTRSAQIHKTQYQSTDWYNDA